MSFRRLRALTFPLLVAKLALIFALTPFVAFYGGLGFGLATVVTAWYLFMRPGLPIQSKVSARREIIIVRRRGTACTLVSNS
jgi:hypothetical protein